jgi:hypothetical protein
VKWFVANITQKQRTGKGAILRVIPNGLASKQHFTDSLLLNPAFGQLLENVSAPLNSSFGNGLTQDRKIERLHLDGQKLSETFSDEKQGKRQRRWGGMVISEQVEERMKEERKN